MIFLSKIFVSFSEFNIYIFSIGFYQMAKIAVTPSIVMAEFVLYRKKVSWPKVNALTLAGHVNLMGIIKRVFRGL